MCNLFLLKGAEHIALMSSEQLTERLVGSFDCKQGAVRAVRFNGESVSLMPVPHTADTLDITQTS